MTPNSGAVVYSFITKLDPAGSGIVYSTILGGSSNTRGYAIQVDGQGNAFVAGVTGARDFPMVNPVQAQQPGLNIGYVAKLNPAGSALLFSTYLGGERNDEIRALALDATGNIHVAGSATSTQIAMTNALQPTFGGNTDILLAKYAAPDYRLVYSTYLGKTGLESAYGVTTDAGGSTYVTGVARGETLATDGAFQNKVNGGNDAFLAKVDPLGRNVVFFTYFGANGDEQARGITLDREGSIWIAGSTTSTAFGTTPTAVQKSLNGDSDAFAVKFHYLGGDVLYSTLLGGSTTRTAVLEEAYAIRTDPRGAVYIAGVTNSSDFLAVRPLQSYGGGVTDGFLTKLSPLADVIEYSTVIGGAADDFVQALAVDAWGGAFLGGRTESPGFPLKNPIRSTFGGSDEGLLMKVCDPSISVSDPAILLTYHVGDPFPLEKPVTVSACAPIPFTATVTGAWLRSSSGSGTTNQTLTLFADPTGLAQGDYAGKLVITALDATNSPVEIPVRLVVAPPRPAISAAGVVNAASGRGGSVTPGEIVTLFGANLGRTS
ncbi:MAG: SBBP repeat-containing protein [Bryobacterales bacterium]